ncbi:MAG: hypothetical protein JWP20_1880 [Roseomonas sp.]|nr:hypothetical protein [Roseomonas sp.]
MTDRGKSLLRFLAVLLLVQWTAALEPCLRSLASIASAQAVTLCSPAGTMRTILLDENGRPVEPVMPHAGCPLCQAAAPAILPEPPFVQAGPVAYLIPLRAATRIGLPPIPPRGPPQQPRAPPIA